MRLRSLVAFWVLAFLVTWAAGILVTLSTQAQLVNGVHPKTGALHLSFAVALALIVLAGFGPAIAAILVSAWERGLPGVKALLAQVLDWRAAPGWYGIALVIPTVLTLIAAGIWVFGLGHAARSFVRLPPTFQLLSLPIAPWGEELGWRGYAQPALQSRLRWPAASLIVGLMWFAWHQWPLLTPGANALDPAGLGIFLVYIVSAAILIGWVYTAAGQRLPLGWAGHAGLNLVGPTPAPFALVAALFAACATVVVGVASRWRLVRRVSFG